MRRLRIAALALAGFIVAGCDTDDFTIGATVMAVQEVHAGKEPEELTLRDEDIRIPEVGWRIELRLDDGEQVSLDRSGGRRYQPGERVRVLKNDEGDLLL
jgi:hypothetical protein